MNPIAADRIREAVTCIAAEINHRVRSGPKAMIRDDQELWRELTCCVLSSQVPYGLAKAAAQRIHEAGVFRSPWPLERDILKEELMKLLSTPLSLDNGIRRYRFPNIRAGQIATAFFTIREEYGSLAEFLNHHTDARCGRAWLVAHAPGVGPKQASMFLRNAAGSFDLAILDRHVLQYMQTIQLCPAPSSNLTTISKYEQCETRLCRHAESMGYEVGLLDWAIWIVMRTASRINQGWAS